MSEILAAQTEIAVSSVRASRREQAAALAATRRRLFLVTTVVSLAAPWLLWSSGLSANLWAALDGVSPWPGLPVQVGVLTLLLALISTPLSYYGGFVVGHRYGLSTQTVGGWIADWLKSTVLVVAITTLGACLFYLTIWMAPTMWAVLYWLEAMAGIVLLTFVAPYVFVPLFFKPKPVDDPGVVMLIEDLVRQAAPEFPV